jgi:hypothetical protein
MKLGWLLVGRSGGHAAVTRQSFKDHLMILCIPVLKVKTFPKKTIHSRPNGAECVTKDYAV